MSRLPPAGGPRRESASLLQVVMADAIVSQRSASGMALSIRNVMESEGARVWRAD